MIIKNVIVYTEDKKFTAGGIVVHDARGHTQFRD